MGKKKKEGSSRPTTLAATYRGAQTLVVLGEPAIRTAAQGGRSPMAFVDAYRDGGASFVGGAALHAIDQHLGQKVVGHNSALARGSLTAWLAESIPMSAAYENLRNPSGGYGASAYADVKTGRDRARGLLYAGLKYGGGVVRKVSNIGALQPIAKPLKAILGEAGGSL